MFAVHCEDCGSRTLIFSSQVEAVVNADDGILVAYHCSRGHHGVLRTGRALPRATTVRELEPAGALASLR